MIIVTGGAGFIGSALISRLSKIKNLKIVLCDAFGTGENKGTFNQER